jgi:hypothetical protein
MQAISSTKTITPFNNKNDLTIEELRSYPGLENMTDEQANQIIGSLKELSILVCYAADKMPYNAINNIDNQHNMSIFANKQAA